MNALDRFWDKVQITNGCWLWTAYCNNRGYGVFQIRYRYPSVYAHRFAYELTIGPIPKGLEIDHLCRTRNCVRPDHLEAVTHLENVRRGVHYNSVKIHCPQGHTYDIITPRGWRQCSTCRRETQRKADHKRRARKRMEKVGSN